MDNAKNPDQKMYASVASKLTSDEATLKHIISTSVSWEPKLLQRLVLGVGNEVYRIIHPTDEKYNVILRIHHGEHPGFSRERWAMGEVSKEGVPIPEILSVETFRTENKILTYCLEKELRGLPLSHVLDGGVEESERKRLAARAGEVLAKIHNVRTRGFGYFVDNGIAEYSTLRESMNQSKDLAGIREAAVKAELSDSVVNRAVDIIHKVESAEQPHLIHVDYAPKHIFIDRGEIVGVIDFEICMSGTAAADINRWRTQDNRIPITELIEGYQKSRTLPQDFWQTMHAVQVHSAMQTMLYHYRITQHVSELRRAANEIKTLVENGQPLLN